MSPSSTPLSASSADSPRALARVVPAMNSPVFDWTRPRAVRRGRLVPLNLGLTVVFVAICNAAGAAWLADRLRLAAGLGVASLLVMVGWMLSAGWLNASVRGTADPLVAHLPGGHDERQRALHASAVRACYWPSLACWSVAMLAVIVARPPVWVQITLFMSAYLVTLMAPLWRLAWTMPDDVPAEE
jgi:hypothetical protein